MLIPAGYGDDEGGESDRPLPRAQNTSTSAFGETPPEPHEAVQFRHTDGNVLAEVMPVLDASQFFRLFGPARSSRPIVPDHPQ